MPPEQQNLLHILDDRAKQHLDLGELQCAMRVSLAAVEAARRAANEDPASATFLLRALKRLGSLRHVKGEVEAAESDYLECLELAEKDLPIDPIELALAKSELAMLYEAMGEEKKAIPHYEGAIGDIETFDLGHRDGAASLRNNLAMILKRIGRLDEAKEQYGKALTSFQKLFGENSEEVAAVYNNLGGLHYAKGEMKEALEMHQKAFEIRNELAGGSSVELGQSLCNLATAYHELNDFSLAEKHYNQALEVLRQHADEDPESYAIASSNYQSLKEANGSGPSSSRPLTKTGSVPLRKAVPA